MSHNKRVKPIENIATTALAFIVIIAIIIAIIF